MQNDCSHDLCKDPNCGCYGVGPRRSSESTSSMQARATAIAKLDRRKSTSLYSLMQSHVSPEMLAEYDSQRGESLLSEWTQKAKFFGIS